LTVIVFLGFIVVSSLGKFMTTVIPLSAPALLPFHGSPVTARRSRLAGHGSPVTARRSRLAGQPSALPQIDFLVFYNLFPGCPKGCSFHRLKQLQASNQRPFQSLKPLQPPARRSFRPGQHFITPKRRSFHRLKPLQASSRCLLTRLKLLQPPKLRPFSAHKPLQPP
jgi:hypothetical protein